jgi:hypothetical protein
MTHRVSAVPRIELDAFGAAVGAALVCGALSVEFPPLLAPTATLAALAVAGWAAILRQNGAPGRNRAASGFSLCVLAGASAAFLVNPPVLGAVRGLLLGAALLPLFLSVRRRSAFAHRFRAD